MVLMKSSGSHDSTTNNQNNNSANITQNDDHDDQHKRNSSTTTTSLDTTHSSSSLEQHARSLSSGTARFTAPFPHHPTMINNSDTNKNSTTPLKRTSTSTTVKLRQIPTCGRRVFFNLPLPSNNNEDDNKKSVFGRRTKKGYVTNKIRTSKYTWWTFVPKNLFEQFRRWANAYFLCMAILQLLPFFGVKSPALTLLPICAVVFISAVKDGFEDYQRHKVDAKYNGTLTHILLGYNNPNYEDTPTSTKRLSTFTSTTAMSSTNTTTPMMAQPPATAAMDSAAAILPSLDDDDAKKMGYFGPSLSKDVRVGDILLLRNGESCPADCVLLSSSDDQNGICFVETKDLDGETNLKPRTAVPSLMHLQSGQDCLQQHFYVESTAPSSDLYTYEGTMVLMQQEENTDKWKEISKTPLSIDHLILRGHVIRNTSWALAVVVLTGTDTKIMLNSGETPSKRSQIEREMNSEILIAFGVLMLLCLVCAIMAGVEKHKDDQNSGTQLYSQQTQSPAFLGFTNFWSSLIIFQNIIPISLYVSIEFVKTFQAYFIWSDLDMWDETTKTSCVPKSWNLSDDLGQIEYLFSDKTGTLTRNIMEFRECTVNGQRYGNNGFAPETEGARGARLRREQQVEQQNDTSTFPLINGAATNTNEKLTPHDLYTSNNNGIHLDTTDTNHMDKDDSHDEQKRLGIFDEYKQAMLRLFTPRYASTDPGRLSFADPRLMDDLYDNNANDQAKPNDHRSTLKEFFTLLAVCHTVVVERIGKDGKPIDDPSDGTENDDDYTRQPQILSASGSVSSSMCNNAGTQMGDDRNEGTVGKKKKKTLAWNPAESLGKKMKKRRQRRRGHSLDAALAQSDDMNNSAVASKRLERVDSTVQEQLDYQAESPDEAALVMAARNAGFAFTGRQGSQQVMVDILGQPTTFELLHMFAFTSTRKRMSVIIRRPAPWNDVVLYSKGADNVMFDRLDHSLDLNKERMTQTQHDIDNYSRDGLRTLVLAYRTINENDPYFQQWQQRMKDASTAVDGRTDQINKLQDEMEQELILLGATAIEDKLQEGVPACIEDLRHAGIKVWVLTGDKLETAINIGYASNLLDTGMNLWVIRGDGGGSDEDESSNDGNQRSMDVHGRLEMILTQLASKQDSTATHDEQHQQQNALVIEGAALSKIYETEEAKSKLLEVALHCKSVVCCRVSPLQKALMVELVRRKQGAVTMAVGDGANDVSMIQAANVGVGIAGQEGVQASMAADYSIAQFRFLRKLLLVQGHWSYERISEMILNFFFKNMVYVFPALWYQIYSRFSGSLFYDYSFLQLYNLIFTVAPVVIIGATDQDITSAYLQRYPQVYQIGMQQKIYTKFRFWLYCADAIWQSLVAFYGFYFLYATDPNPQGYPETVLQLSTSVVISVIVLANMMPGFNTYYWTWWQFVFVTLELLVTFLWVVVYGSFQDTALYGMAYIVFGGWSFWLTFFLVIVLAFLPRYTCTFVIQWWYPDVMHLVRHIEMDEKRKAISSMRQRRHRNCWPPWSGKRWDKSVDDAKQPV